MKKNLSIYFHFNLEIPKILNGDDTKKPEHQYIISQGLLLSTGMIKTNKNVSLLL